MFLCATSAQKDSNDAIDLTPAMFKNDLDEPIKVQNFEIELVSSIIRKDNIITIQSPENLLLFRLGPVVSSEQYTAEIPQGNYTVNELSTQIAQSLNDAVPCNAWRGWSCTTDANNKFTITFTPVTVPTTNTAIKESMVEAYGFQTTLSGTGGPAFRATLEADFSSDGLGNAGIETVENLSSYVTHLADPDIVQGGSYFGIDSGNPLVEDFQQTKIDEAGIFESDGKCEFILRPVEVFQTSGIYAPATTVTDRYLTLEADVETTVYDPVDYPESFIQGEPMIHYEDDLGNLSNHSQRNGIFIEPGANNNANQRGLPYTRANHTLVFPSATTNNIDARKEAYRNTFGANMIFETSTTQPLPNRCFRIDPNETPAIKSESSLQFIEEAKEKLSFRLSTSPLITGLKNKDNNNITPSDILVNPVLDSMPTALHRYDFATNETSITNSTITLQDSTTADVIDLTNSPDTNVILSETTGIQATNSSSNPSSVGTSIRMQTIAGGLTLTDGRKVSFETYFKGIEASGDNGYTDNIFSFYKSDGTAQGIALHIDGIGSIGRIALSLEGFGGVVFSQFFVVPPGYEADDPGFERNPSMPGFRHIVVTIDSSQASGQQVRIYVDGVQASPTAFLTITQNTLFSGVELTPFVNRRITHPNSSAVPLTTARGNTQVKYVRVFDGILQQTQINEMFSKRENVGTPEVPTPKVKYIVDSEGIMNNRGFGMSATNFQDSLQGKLVTGDGRTVYKMPRYKILSIDATTFQPTSVQLLDSGEHIGLTATANFGNMFLNDPNTFSIEDPSTSDDVLVTDHCSKINVDSTSRLGNQGTIAATTTAQQWLPTEVSLVNDLIYQANRTLTETADVNNFSPPNKVNFSKDIAVKVVPLSVTATTGFVEFEITQFQPLRKTFNDDEEDIFDTFAQTGGDVNERKLLLKCRPFTWNSFTGTGGYTAPTNWTSAWTAPTANHRLKITFEQEGIFATDIKVSFSTDGGTTFVQEQRLLQTGNKVTNVPPNSFQEMKQVIQPRLFPLHPCISMYPTKYRNDPAGSRPSELGLIGSNYFNNSSYTKTNSVVLGNQGNYRKNLEFMTSGANQPSIFDMVVSGKLTPDQTKPQIVLKTKSHPITIDDVTALPLAVGSIRALDLPPNRGSLGNVIGLGSVYTAVANFAAAGKIDFVGTSDATITPYVPSIAVEINNIPITGYIGKEYNLRDEQVGVGSRLPIVGVIPSLEQATAINKAQLAFRYNAPYSQPVVCKLPTEIFLYNISFRLREIQSGEIVKGLKHPTELIFRIKNLEDNEEKNNIM